VSLQGWRLRGAVDFDFGPAHLIGPGQVLVVVPFAPTDVAKAEAFRLAYAITEAVPLTGPWSAGDHLANADDCVLYRADTPPPGEPGYHPLTLEDAVTYLSTAGWPNTVDGLSLNRRGTTTWGEASTSWKGDVPSPGSLHVSYNTWKAWFYPGGIANDADSDGDGASTVEEYGFATDPLIWENQASNVPVVTTENVGGQINYIFTYSKPLDRNATYAVEQSTDLVNWSPAPDQLVSSTIDSEIRRAIVPVPAGATELFLRLRIATQ
jgi:hypothetical protein